MIAVRVESIFPFFDLLHDQVDQVDDGFGVVEHASIVNRPETLFVLQVDLCFLRTFTNDFNDVEFSVPSCPVKGCKASVNVLHIWINIVFNKDPYAFGLSRFVILIIETLNARQGQAVVAVLVKFVYQTSRLLLCKCNLFKTVVDC